MHLRLLFTKVAFVLPLSLSLAAATLAEPRDAPAAIPVHGMPKILSVDFPADRDFHAGQTVRCSVVTSPVVTYVEARVKYRNAPMHNDGAGRFSLVYTIPWWLPPWLRHEWTLQIIARSSDGVEVKEDFPIRVH